MEKNNKVLAWILAILPVPMFALCLLNIFGKGVMAAIINFAIYYGVTRLLMVGDLFLVKRAGGKVITWFWTIFIFPTPVYLFMRSFYTDSEFSFCAVSAAFEFLYYMIFASYYFKLFQNNDWSLYLLPIIFVIVGAVFLARFLYNKSKMRKIEKAYKASQAQAEQ